MCLERGDGSNPSNFSPKFTFHLYTDTWHQCPFDTRQGAENFLHALKHCNPEYVPIVTAYGDGKEREIDAARRSAIWPDGTVDQLTDRDALMARLPALMAEFKRDIEALGFTY